MKTLTWFLHILVSIGFLGMAVMSAIAGIITFDPLSLVAEILAFVGAVRAMFKAEQFVA